MTASGMLEVTTAKVCSVNCYPHCPQLAFRDKYGTVASQQLAYDDFVRAIDSIPSSVTIAFSGFSEPFASAIWRKA